MKKKKTKTANKNNIKRIAIVVGLILLLPLIGTLLNPSATVNGGPGGGWDWGFGDFIIMGALLFITGLAIDYAWRKINHPTYRVLAVLVIVFILLALWVELATDGVSRIIQSLLG